MDKYLDRIKEHTEALAEINDAIAEEMSNLIESDATEITLNQDQVGLIQIFTSLSNVDVLLEQLEELR